MSTRRGGSRLLTQRRPRRRCRHPGLQPPALGEASFATDAQADEYSKSMKAMRSRASVCRGSWKTPPHLRRQRFLLGALLVASFYFLGRDVWLRHQAQESPHSKGLTRHRSPSLCTSASPEDFQSLTPSLSGKHRPGRPRLGPHPGGRFQAGRGRSPGQAVRTGPGQPGPAVIGALKTQTLA